MADPLTFRTFFPHEFRVEVPLHGQTTYFYQLNHHRQAGQRAFVFDVRKIPAVTMYHVSQRTAGKLFCLSRLNVSDLLAALEKTPKPDDVIYVASDEALEACPSVEKIAYSLFGGMPIQVGYCNGSNYLLNAVEYHRDSEVNVALTDLILILGKEQDIEADGTYQTEKMEAFLVPAGTVVEVYATTLVYALWEALC